MKSLDKISTRALYSVLSTGCDGVDNRTILGEVFVKAVPQALILESIKTEIKSFEEESRLQQIFGVSLRCDKNQGKSYTWMMSNSNPKFFVHLNYKNQFYEILQKFVDKKKLKIRTLYSLIFSMIFLSFIRPQLTGKTTNLGAYQLPRTEVFQILLDGMESSRKEKELIKEQLLFSRLIDIMRDPSTVAQTTGKVLRSRETNVYERFQYDE